MVKIPKLLLAKVLWPLWDSLAWSPILDFYVQMLFCPHQHSKPIGVILFGDKKQFQDSDIGEWQDNMVETRKVSWGLNPWLGLNSLSPSFLRDLLYPSPLHIWSDFDLIIGLLGSL